MQRERLLEILDGEGVPEELVSLAYRDLARIHWWLGDTYSVMRAIRHDPLPVHRILDVGCGTGSVVTTISRKLGIEAIGVDLRPRFKNRGGIPIIQADAVTDPLPNGDVAYCMHLGHHLSEGDLIELIRNVGRSCRRFILLDLVRHPLPLALFRLFVAPLVCRIVVVDGERSIRRSYTPVELRRIVESALEGSGGSFRHWVTPLFTRQVVDVTYAPQDEFLPELVQVQAGRDLLG